MNAIFVSPFLERAAAERFPNERSRLASLAGVNALLHPMVELYLAKIQLEIIRSGQRCDLAALDNKPLMKLFQVLCSLAKGR